MKKLYFCLWLVLWAPTQLLAQVSDPTRAALDNLFAPLDKSQIPTGFLAEDAMPLVPLDVFNGTLTDSSRTSPDGFRYLYATLYSARVYGTQPLLSLQDYNTRTATAITGASVNTIPVMVQRVDYAAVRSDAFNSNLLVYSNGQVRDVAGRSQSPYLVRTAFWGGRVQMDTELR